MSRTTRFDYERGRYVANVTMHEVFQDINPCDLDFKTPPTFYMFGEVIDRLAAYEDHEETVMRLQAQDMPSAISYIIERQDTAEILAALAEEAAELAQAALKLRRALGSGSPTPIGKDLALQSLIEEMGDVECCSKVICAALSICPTKDIEPAATAKLHRWAQRIEKEERDDD